MSAEVELEVPKLPNWVAIKCGGVSTSVKLSVVPNGTRDETLTHEVPIAWREVVPRAAQPRRGAGAGAGHDLDTVMEDVTDAELNDVPVVVRRTLAPSLARSFACHAGCHGVSLLSAASHRVVCRVQSNVMSDEEKRRRLKVHSVLFGKSKSFIDVTAVDVSKPMDTAPRRSNMYSYPMANFALVESPDESAPADPFPPQRQPSASPTSTTALLSPSMVHTA